LAGDTGAGELDGEPEEAGETTEPEEGDGESELDEE